MKIELALCSLLFPSAVWATAACGTAAADCQAETPSMMDSVSAPVLLAVSQKLHSKAGKLGSEQDVPLTAELQQSGLSKQGNDTAELPGDADAHGPDAIGDVWKAHPLLKYGLAVLVMLTASSPAMLVCYFYFNPGDMDGSPEVMEEQGVALSLAVEKAAARLYRAGHVFFRVGMFLVYFWFGILKVFGISPAEPLVQIVYRELPFIQIGSASWFCKWMVGGGEVVMSLIYLGTILPQKTVRFYCTVLSITVGMGHILMVSLLPMVLLPGEVWQEHRFPYALTFEGQYIMKNVILLSGFMMMGSDLTSPDFRKSRPAGIF
eukprot:CAMPEP_0178444228 /NCGR_PEP_ID=MMETSP0689_2-20121128/39370_1 /TAXON_ID=160604 /ORGANISM="Amphidinium massartii, Strain CS-259" /LENGTH=319 /DNA_ID=CAMNT_0020068395 /DNA_START=32 /DNA_END=991 /DNA_ORIENTATION=+